MKVAITGATGFIGTPLVVALQARGDEVVAFTRDPARARLQGTRLVEADLEQPGAWQDAVAGCDAVINLAGEPVAGRRWDARQKQRLRDSRIETTQNLVAAIAKAQPRPLVLVSASGVDYYPFANGEIADFDDDEVTEADPAGEDFLARLCKAWEAEALTAEALGVRVVTMRTGLVLGAHGGALAKMTTPFKLFAGGRIGSGRQWMAWIHLDDAVAAYLAALDDAHYRGPINLVTDSIRNAEFSKQLGGVLHRPSWLPVPAFALRAAVGELAETLLNGRRVVPAKLRERGFTWKHPELREALASTR
ncbi:MAG: TIGR01777 family oxidoreductase [Deltaproteobacteria bacterium]